MEVCVPPIGPRNRQQAVRHIHLAAAVDAFLSRAFFLHNAKGQRAGSAVSDGPPGMLSSWALTETRPAAMQQVRLGFQNGEFWSFSHVSRV